VRDGVAEFFRDRALALADIVTPNRFELEFLTGRAVSTIGDAGEAAATLRRQGPGVVLVTSLDIAPDQMTILASGPDGAWAIETPRLPVMLNGCGDVTAALFLGHLVSGASLADALARTAASMFAVIETTVGLGRYELALVAAREELARPSRVFEPRRL
jgi:pyridoxine kinase